MTNPQSEPYEWGKVGCILIKIWNQTRRGNLTISIQYSFGNFRAIRQEKEIKQIQIWKQELILSLFADVMILYIGKPRDSTRRLLELIKEFGKVTWYKINICKSVILWHIRGHSWERTYNISPIHNSYKKSTYLGIHLTKDVKYFYNENCKTKRKTNHKNMETFPCSFIIRSNINKMSMLPKVIFRFKAIPIKIQKAFFPDLEKNDPEIHMETEKTLNS